MLLNCAQGPWTKIKNKSLGFLLMGITKSIPAILTEA